MDFEELLDTQAINYDDVIPSRIYLALSVYSLMLLFLIKTEKQNLNLSNVRKHAKLYSSPVSLISSFSSKPLYKFLQTFTKREVAFYYKRERLKISFSFFFSSSVSLMAVHSASCFHVSCGYLQGNKTKTQAFLSGYFFHPVVRFLIFYSGSNVTTDNEVVVILISDSLNLWIE